MYKLHSLKAINVFSLKELLLNQEDLSQNTIVFGENLDDGPGQEKNGSGKSSILEAIAIALTGYPIKDCAKKDIIHDLEDEAKVELTLIDKKDNIFCIVRDFNRKNPEKVQCFLNNEPIVQSDVDAYNAFILQELGIDKNDLFNNYLISAETYESFISVGDKAKKEIIGRFIGVDYLDNANQLINPKLAEFTKKKQALLQSKANIEGKKDIIQLELNKLFIEGDSFIENQIKSINTSIADLNTKELELLEEKKIKQEELKQLSEQILIKNLPEKEVTFQKESSAIEKQKEEIILSLDQIKETLKLTQQETIQVKQDLQQLEDQLNSNFQKTKRSLLQVDQSIMKINSSLSGTITCPKCSYQFLLNAEETVEELQKSFKKLSLNKSREEILLDSNNKEIKNFEKEKEEILQLSKDKVAEQDKIVAQQRQLLNDIDTQVFQLRNVLNTEKKNIQELENKKNQIKTSINHINSTIKVNEEQISSFEEQKKSLLNSNILKEKMNIFTIQIVNYTEEILVFQEQLEFLDIEHSQTEQWINNFKSFKSIILNEILIHIEELINNYLDIMNSSLSIKLEGYKTTSTKKLKEEIECFVSANKKDFYKIGKFSAGEKARINLATIFAFQDLINSNCKEGKGLNFLMIDEILDAVDRAGLKSITSNLPEDKICWIISQNTIDSQIKSITVTKKQRYSYLN